jgi:itaconyl-CoA hydratase
MTVREGWLGRFFEDFQVGDVYRARTGRTILEADNVLFTLMSNNTNQIHFNTEYARHSGFDRPLVNSIVTLAVVAGLGVGDTSENGFALGWDYIRLPNPVFAGDTLYSESRVLDVRASGTRPQQGIVKVRTLGLKQDGTVVIDYARSIMVWRRAAAPSRAAFPEAKDVAPA